MGTSSVTLDDLGTLAENSFHSGSRCNEKSAATDDFPMKHQLFCCCRFWFPDGMSLYVFISLYISMSLPWQPAMRMHIFHCAVPCPQLALAHPTALVGMAPAEGGLSGSRFGACHPGAQSSKLSSKSFISWKCWSPSGPKTWNTTDPKPKELLFLRPSNRTWVSGGAPLLLELLDAAMKP